MSGCIICRVTAGLGNQLFQYAVCKAIALENKLDLAIDTSYFRYPWKPYYLRHRVRHQLPDIGLKEAEVGKGAGLLVGLVTRYTKGARLYNWLVKLFGLHSRLPLVAYSKESLAEILEEDSPRLILKGYWQNYPEMGEAEAEIRSEFNLTPDPADNAYVERIEGAFATALHIRLGDYVTDPSIAQTYARISADYYRRAMDRIRKAAKGRKCLFLVFSNDIEQAREILGSDPEMLYVDDVNNDIREFRLMARCANQVIGNSTFSWWAAMLNPNPEKIVIAPKRWFTDPNREGGVWIPDNWLREEN